MRLNNNFDLLSKSYLFSEVKKRVENFSRNHPDLKVIRMDIGDVSLPLPEGVCKAMDKAAYDMSKSDTFMGYGPEQGYAWLREKIALNDYQMRNIDIKADEVFVSDGAKCDIANLTDIFDPNAVVAMQDPVYPVYFDSNVIASRTVENGRIKLLHSGPETRFKPEIPREKVDVVYLCSPNNPTGTALDRNDLKKWVDYALENDALIIYDSAYEAFIFNQAIPKSIYEIPGAEKVAIEVRSYSKTAGFTGLRCGYTVVPFALTKEIEPGKRVPVRDLWLRRQTTKFNGASYIIQRGAEALYDEKIKGYLTDNIKYYLRNASMLRDALEDQGLNVYGGEFSPYVWLKADNGMDSWSLFDLILEKCHLSSTPGVGFGRNGEGCIRFTGFNTFENTVKAVERLRNLKL